MGRRKERHLEESVRILRVNIKMEGFNIILNTDGKKGEKKKSGRRHQEEKNTRKKRRLGDG